MLYVLCFDFKTNVSYNNHMIYNSQLACIDQTKYVDLYTKWILYAAVFTKCYKINQSTTNHIYFLNHNSAAN